MQMTLFGYVDHPLVDELRNLQIDAMTPIDALQMLQQWQQKILAGEDTPTPARSK